MDIVKIRIAIIFAFAAILCGCSQKDKPADIIGEWNLTDMELTKSVSIGTETIDIYISFAADNTFNLWQFIGAGRYEHFTGTWALTEGLLTGKYSDGAEWGNAYTVSCSDDILTMTATVNSSDVYVYTRCTIPENIKQ